MISGGRLIGRAEDEVERAERELASCCLYVCEGRENQRQRLEYTGGQRWHTFCERAAAGFRDLGSRARQIGSRRGSESHL